MDPFTQRMLERARARQEKIDQKLANSGQTVPQRKPLAENVSVLKSESSPKKSPLKPVKDSLLSPKKSSRESIISNSPVKRVQRDSSNSNSLKNSYNKKTTTNTEAASLQRPRNDYTVTKKEFKSPRSSGNSRNSDVSVEINIMHRNDIQIEVQVEERDAPINIVNDAHSDSGSDITVTELKENTSKMLLDKDTNNAEHKSERGGLRNNFKSRLDRLGNLYSDKPTLSSPVHRTELEFNSETPPTVESSVTKAKLPKEGKKKFGRLAALADQINNWEDDLTHHSFNPEPTKKSNKKQGIAKENTEESTLEVSVHSIKDINNVLSSTKTKVGFIASN